MRTFFRVFLVLSLFLLWQGCRKPVESGGIPVGMILIKGGTFQMGSEDGMPYESPVHAVELNSFFLDDHEVTVAEFSEFVTATSYRTDAEKFGWSVVFDLKTHEWIKGDGADWRHPEGPGSTSAENEPVCQVSWNDASEYAKWAGKRLPTEAEFEFAARGGLDGKEYAWGNELKPDGKLLANWWQGNFPDRNTVEDGFLSRAPVRSFPPNGYGLYDITGNVWEWCSDRFDEIYYENSPKHGPKGPDKGDERVIRGGSFLCAGNYCANYRVAGRSHSTPDSGMNNLGFRCARDIK
jgi:sulfatase modifying factor 1